MLKKLFSKDKSTKIKTTHTDGILKSPIKGKILSLTEVPDEAFAGKMLGDGIAIDPSEGIVYSPVDGEVIQLFLPSKHAVCIKSRDGIEILIHIGLDTVKMNGYGFESLVSVGDKVTCGQELIKFDLDKVKSSAKSAITPVVITNSHELNKINILADGNILVGSDLMKIDK